MRWHLYFAHGRRQVRLGVWRARPDRAEREYRFIAIEWQL